MSPIPSIVPPNQTQASRPSGRMCRFAAWFCTMGEGRKASTRPEGETCSRPSIAASISGVVNSRFGKADMGNLRVGVGKDHKLSS